MPRFRRSRLNTSRAGFVLPAFTSASPRWIPSIVLNAIEKLVGFCILNDHFGPPVDRQHQRVTAFLERSSDVDLLI
jgi:hypothetical protein